MTTKTQLLTIADWDAMPAKDGYRYEIIEGELFVSCSPGLTHQVVSDNLVVLLRNFLKLNPIGVAVSTPGLVLSEYSGVIPDIVFFRRDQRDTIVTNDRLSGPPALVIEILSPGSANIRRDRVSKLQLYAKHGVPEYWIIDSKNLTVERYVSQGSSLILSEALGEEKILTTAALPGFSCLVSDIFTQF